MNNLNLNADSKINLLGKTYQQHKIICENRKLLILSGVEKVHSANSNIFNCKINGQELSIEGENIEVVKLDVEQGNVELKGNFNGIKYTGEKRTFFKRLFK